MSQTFLPQSLWGCWCTVWALPPSKHKGFPLESLRSLDPGGDACIGEEQVGWGIKTFCQLVQLFPMLGGQLPVPWLPQKAAKQSWSVQSRALSIHGPCACKPGSGACHCACGSLELPKENKAAQTGAQQSLVTTLSRFLGLSQVPQLDLSCLLYFTKLASESPQEHCVLSLLEGHRRTLCYGPYSPLGPHSPSPSFFSL